MKTDYEKMLNLIDTATTIMRQQSDMTIEQWEIARNSWVNLGIKVANARPPGVDNADQYTTLDEVQIDNFDDAMKVLK